MPNNQTPLEQAQSATLLSYIKVYKPRTFDELTEALCNKAGQRPRFVYEDLKFCVNDLCERGLISLQPAPGARVRIGLVDLDPTPDGQVRVGVIS